MASTKTAISVDGTLLFKAEKLARKMNVSRSRLFAIAVEELIQRHQNKELLDQINGAYGDGPTSGEKQVLRRMRRTHRKLVEGEW